MLWLVAAAALCRRPAAYRELMHVTFGEHDAQDRPALRRLEQYVAWRGAAARAHGHARL